IRSAGFKGQSRRPVRQPAKTRTSSVWLITALPLWRRLSSVVDGRNGARIGWLSRQITPIGAICAAPPGPTVVMMLSMIMASRVRLRAAALPARAEGRAGRAVRGRRLRIDGAAPAQSLVLDVALAELPGDFGARQLDAEIKGMRTIFLDAELGIEIEGGARYLVLVAVVEVDAVGSDLDAEIAIADLRRGIGDLGGRAGIGAAVAQRHQARLDADGNPPHLVG